MNYFEVFGLPKRLDIDSSSLERKFHELSRKYHPDYYNAAPAEEKQQALRMTALINDAYRTLRHPIRRVEYLVQLEGFKPDGSKVPRAFLMDIFEINEQLAEIKSGSANKDQLVSLREEISGRAAAFNAQLEDAARQWNRLLAADASGDALKTQLGKLTEILSESSYIRNLERELEEAS